MSGIQQLLLGGSGNSTIIKQIVQFSTTIAAGAGSANQDVSAYSFTVANCIIIWQGNTGAHTSNNLRTDTAQMYWTGGNSTITVQRNLLDASNALVLNYTIIEFQAAAIRSIQYASIDCNGVSTNTATISSITTTNSILVYAGIQTTNSSGSTASFMTAQITNATTITALTGATGNKSIYVWVLEFASGVLNSSTQQPAVSLVAPNLTNDQTLSAVTMNQTWCPYGGQSVSVADANSYGQLTSTTNFKGTRSNATHGFSMYCGVVEFKASNVKSVQRGTIVIGTSSNSQTATISSVGTKAFVNWIGQTNSGATTTTAKGQSKIELTDATTVTATRSNADASSTLTVSYEVINFY